MSNEAYLSRLKSVECPDATYPAVDPALVMHRALGSRVYDAQGRCYIDLCAGFGALALGHNPLAHQKILTTRIQSLGGEEAPLITHGMGDVYASTAKVRLLEFLLGAMPRIFSAGALALTGAQAVELAIKTAILATGRDRFVAFAGGYHGLDLGILPLTARGDFRKPFQGFIREDQIQRLAFGGQEQELREALKDGTVAAVIVEPVQGRAGGRAASVSWLQMLRRVCSEAGTLLIFDEVFTGLGRTGRMTFAEEVPCDLLCLGKALGGGFPVSACLGTKAVMDAWPASKGEALHTGTFFGHPLGCDVALATLQEIVEQKLASRSASLGAEALAWLQRELGDCPSVAAVRGLGLMLAVELKRPGDGARLMDLLRARGIIALASGPSGESLSITPALNVERDVLWAGLSTLKATIALLEMR